MRPAKEGDLRRVRDFLKQHIATSMFPLSNLDRYGTGGHPRSLSFWIDETDGKFSGVLSMTEVGMIFPQIRVDQAASALDAIKGRTAIGIIGEAKQVSALLDKMLGPIATTMNEVEPHFALSLNELRPPVVEGYSLVPLSNVDFDHMLKWRTAYEVEALNSDPKVARYTARKNMEDYIKHDTHRVLLVDGVPVCTTGFNAQAENCVQVGGVYTPPELRNRGFARSAVARHLQEAKDKGVKEAILFSSSAAAAVAYRAIGFKEIGEFSLTLFKEAQVIHV